MIIWITGLSGVGKSTIAKGIFKKYKSKIKHLVCVDGDIIRELYGKDLGYDERSRIKQIKRIQNLCLFLERQELIVLVSALFSNSKLMYWNRKNFKKYYEIYLQASVELLQKRDPKGLYKKFKSGKEKNIVGLDIKWNEPEAYDLLINMDKENTIENSVKKVLNNLSNFSNEFKV